MIGDGEIKHEAPASEKLEIIGLVDNRICNRRSARVGAVENGGATMALAVFSRVQR